MVEISVVYHGELHTEATHGPSGRVLETDAPRDNQGRGASFSPTDLLATALGTCMLTVMAIAARNRQIPMDGAQVRVEKHMIADPLRRVGKLVVEFRMPRGLDARARTTLENAALTCPVHRSLHPDVEIPVTFRYPDDDGV